jgi:hypothetical protein
VTASGVMLSESAVSDPTEVLTVELTREEIVALCWLGAARLGLRQAKQQAGPPDPLVLHVRSKLATAIGEANG